MGTISLACFMATCCIINTASSNKWITKHFVTQAFTSEIFRLQNSLQIITYFITMIFKLLLTSCHGECIYLWEKTTFVMRRTIFYLQMYMKRWGATWILYKTVQIVPICPFLNIARRVKISILKNLGPVGSLGLITTHFSVCFSFCCINTIVWTIDWKTINIVKEWVKIYSLFWKQFCISKMLAKCHQ